MPLKDFDILAANNNSLDEEVQNKKTKKPKNTTPKIPVFKPNASIIKEINSLGKAQNEKKDLFTKIKELEKVDRLKTHFATEFSKKGIKYPKISLANTLDEITAQKIQITSDLSSEQSIPNTYRFFKVCTQFIQKSMHEVLGLPMKSATTGETFSEICNSEPTFSALFARPLAIIAIQHGLFKTGPWVDLIIGLSTVFVIVNNSNNQTNSTSNFDTEEDLAAKFSQL